MRPGGDGPCLQRRRARATPARSTRQQAPAASPDELRQLGHVGPHVAAALFVLGLLKLDRLAVQGAQLQAGKGAGRQGACWVLAVCTRLVGAGGWGGGCAWLAVSRVCSSTALPQVGAGGLTRASLDRYLRPERSKSMPAASSAAATSSESGGTSAPGASTARAATPRRASGAATQPARRACVWRGAPAARPAAAGCAAGAATAARMVCERRRRAGGRGEGGSWQGGQLVSRPLRGRAALPGRHQRSGSARGSGRRGSLPRSQCSCGLVAMETNLAKPWRAPGE